MSQFGGRLYTFLHPNDERDPYVGHLYHVIEDRKMLNRLINEDLVNLRDHNDILLLCTNDERNGVLSYNDNLSSLIENGWLIIEGDITEIPLQEKLDEQYRMRKVVNDIKELMLK